MAFSSCIFLHLACIIFLISTSQAAKDYEKTVFYTSVASIKDLLQTEETVVVRLSRFLNLQTHFKCNATWESILNYIKKPHFNAMKNPNYALNPINAFKLIKRMTLCSRLLNRTVILKNLLTKIPTNEDVPGAVRSFVRLQTIYSLKVEDLSRGLIKGNFSQTGEQYIEQVDPMTADDCYHIAINLQSPNNKINNLRALEWLQQALKKSELSTYDNNVYDVNKEQIISAIIMTYKLMEDHYNTSIWVKRIFENLKFRPDLIENYKNNLKNDPRKTLSILSKENKPEMKYDFKNLCQGINMVPPQISKRLKCKYMTDKRRFTRLRPYKVEQLYPDPEILMIHDFASDYEMELLREFATPNLKNAELITDEGEIIQSEWRTSKTAFVPTYIGRNLWLSKRIERFTGFELRRQTDWIVENFGIGGHFYKHCDFLPPHLVINGNILSSFSIFLSDVEQGGAIVFISLGLPVFPEKGAALYFRNLLNAGDGDTLTDHVDCPVLVGDKWIMTKFYNSSGQELVAPCWIQTKKSLKQYPLSPSYM